MLIGLVLLWRLRIGYLLVHQRQLESMVAARTREVEEARRILFKQATKSDAMAERKSWRCCQDCVMAIAIASRPCEPGCSRLLSASKETISS